ncbi:hypothetical protein L0B53_04310 [Vibrio sp. SS-MA-C1-2]|uniref:hypothetical protein n=1 Tax=Vibrio sp. SS-MA-C1-2 TaxID=2908646 RepID=UPI001F1779E3|nr:hypothetical protein [Vibrio sp. SS-MA-C1-2]UJF17146.1 hypothetical protein L0B53_04310 [Vibrio sp. SS-MA-C1-2]
MKHTLTKTKIASLLSVILLAGCNPDNSPPVEVQQSDVKLISKGTNLKFQWQSTLNEEERYTVQIADENSNTWSDVAVFGAVKEGVISEKRFARVSGQYRIMADMPNGTQRLLASKNGTTVFDFDKQAADSVQIDAPAGIYSGTLNDTINFNVEGPIALAKWEMDNQTVCLDEANSCDEQSLTLSTEGYSAGKHIVSVMGEVSPGVYVEKDKEIEIFNNNPIVSLGLLDEFCGCDLTTILADASGFSEVTDVIYTIDGEYLAQQSTLKEKTLIDGRTWGSHFTNSEHRPFSTGEHTFKVEMLGVEKSASKEMTTYITNAPKINILHPRKNEIITGNTLVIEGEIQNEDDELTTVFYLGNERLPKPEGFTGRGKFKIEYDLTDKIAADHTITIHSVDTRTEVEKVIESQESVVFSYTPKFAETRDSANAELVHTLDLGHNVIQINGQHLLSADLGIINELDRTYNYTITDLIEQSDTVIETHLKNYQADMHNARINEQGQLAVYSQDFSNGEEGLLLYTNGKSDLHSDIDVSKKANFTFKDNLLIEISEQNLNIWNTETENNALMPTQVPAPEGYTWNSNKSTSHSNNWVCAVATSTTDSTEGVSDLFLIDTMGEMTPIKVTGDHDGQSVSCLGNDEQFAFYKVSEYNSADYSIFKFDIANNVSELVTDNAVGFIKGNILASNEVILGSENVAYKNGTIAWQENVAGSRTINFYRPDGTGVESIENATLLKMGQNKVSYSTQQGLFVLDLESQEAHKLWNKNVKHFLNDQGAYIINGNKVYQVKF